LIKLQGEYECKVDAKGRFRMPSQLVKQLGAASTAPLHINRGMEKCLTLYPDEVWQVVTEKINSLNLYKEQSRQFARYFYRGATELTMDKTDRLLLPKSLADYAGIGADIILFAYHNRIEVWAKDIYEEMMDNEPADFSKLANEVMGDSF
jgi:MraZ protein